MLRDQMRKYETMQTQASEAGPALLEIDAPMSGELVALNHVPDEVFASGAMGEGIAILPENGTVVAPCDGAVMYSVQFGHAIGVTSSDGAEILIHIGLDAGERKDQPFQCHVKGDQKVKRGDLLLTFNLSALKQAGERLYTLVTVTNSSRFSSVRLSGGGAVRAGEPLMTVC